MADHKNAAEAPISSLVILDDNTRNAISWSIEYLCSYFLFFVNYIVKLANA